MLAIKKKIVPVALLIELGPRYTFSAKFCHRITTASLTHLGRTFRMTSEPSDLQNDLQVAVFDCVQME